MGICRRKGCDNDAVAVVLVRRDPIEKLDELCRDHLVEDRRAAGVLVSAVVTTNRAAIVGVDGAEHRRGEPLELDTEEIDVDMLVRLGYIEVTGKVPGRVADPAAEAEALRAEQAELERRSAELAQRVADAEKAAAKQAADEAAEAKRAAKEAEKEAVAAEKTAEEKEAEAAAAKDAAAAAADEAKAAKTTTPKG